MGDRLQQGIQTRAAAHAIPPFPPFPRSPGYKSSELVFSMTELVFSMILMLSSIAGEQKKKKGLMQLEKRGFCQHQRHPASAAISACGILYTMMRGLRICNGVLIS